MPFGRSRCVVAAIVITLAPIARAEAQGGSTCTMDRMEVAPHAAVDACTALLQQEGLTAQQRGMALFVRGRGYHRTRRVQLAEKDYDAALQLIPNNDELYVSRANAATRLGNAELGFRFLSRALELNPRNAHALRFFGSFLAAYGKPEQAIEYYQRALDIDPAEAYALHFRSELYAERGQYALALADADALVALSPEIKNRQGYLDEHGLMRDFHVVALTHRGELHAQTGHMDFAEQDFNAAIAYRRSAEALKARADYFYYRRNAPEAALTDLNAALAIEPDNAPALYSKGIVLTKQNRFEEAFAAFNHAVGIEPAYARALKMRARMHRQFGRTEEAVSDFEMAIAISPDILAKSIPALRHRGYWTSLSMPTSMTPELQDAIRACMIDTTCN